jgi:hypothetical protein
MGGREARSYLQIPSLCGARPRVCLCYSLARSAGAERRPHITPDYHCASTRGAPAPHNAGVPLLEHARSTRAPQKRVQR